MSGQRSLWGRVVRIIGKAALILVCVVLAAVLAAAGVVWGLWHNEIRAFLSFEQVRGRDYNHSDGAVYRMHVPGGFYLEEFIEQGGAKSDDELIGFVTEKITKGLIPMEIKRAKLGCSSFTAQTAEGDKLFARNYDMKETNVCIVTTDGGRGRHATISTADLQFLGLNRYQDVDDLTEKILCLAVPYIPLDGINDAGVSCGIYMSTQGGKRVIATDQDTDRPDVTSSMLLRLILDYADDLDEAIEIAKSYDLHDSANTSYHYMVADASGRSAILEWINPEEKDDDGSKRELVVIYNDADADVGAMEAESEFQCVTNFIVAPGYYDINTSQGKPGLDRYDALYETLSETGGVVQDEQAAMDILAMVGRRKWPDDDGYTIHSAVYNMTDKTVLWVSNENYEDETAVFRLKLD